MTKILIVDDDLVSRVLTRHIVNDLGYEFSEASNGAEALKLFAETAFDVVLCDQEMPQMKGLEVLEALRQTSDVPFILLTGYAEEEELQTNNQPVDSYITKPFSSTELQTAILQYVTNSDAEAKQSPYLYSDAAAKQSPYL